MKHAFRQTFKVCFILIIGICGRPEVLDAQPAELPARAFTNVTLHHADGTVTEQANIVWRGGVIEAAGKNITIPFDARVTNGGDSLHVYPGFISGYANWGAPDREQFRGSPPVPGYPDYARAGIQTDAAPERVIEDKPVFKEALKAGFTTSVIGLNGYMMPGHLTIFHLSDSDVKDKTYQRGIGQHFKFDYARGAYPSTLMGTMARLRQLFFDAQALREHHQLFASSSKTSEISVPEHDAILEALFPIIDGTVPLFVQADTPPDIERMLRLKSELGFEMVIIGGKQAWPMAERLAAENIPVLLTLELPEKTEWMKEADKKNDEESNSDEKSENDADEKEDNTEEETLTEEEKLYRERQMESRIEQLNNLRVLLDAGVKTGLALNGVKVADFNTTLQTLLEHGYTESELLNMLTAQTAGILKQTSRLGDIREGMIANMAVFNGSAFDKKPKAVYTVSAGRLYQLENLD